MRVAYKKDVLPRFIPRRRNKTPAICRDDVFSLIGTSARRP